MIPSQISFNTLPVNATYASETTVDTQKFSDILYSAGCSLKDLAYLSRCLASIHPTIAKNIYETENLSDQKLLHIDCRSTNEIKINIFFGQQREGLIEINSDTVIFPILSSLIDSAISKFQHQILTYCMRIILIKSLLSRKWPALLPDVIKLLINVTRTGSTFMYFSFLRKIKRANKGHNSHESLIICYFQHYFYIKQR